jgi:hypothetical protein
MRPGWKTTEFWLTLAANVVSLVYMSGVPDMTDTDWDNRALGMVSMVLINLGYQVSRSFAKRGQ